MRPLKNGTALAAGQIAKPEDLWSLLSVCGTADVIFIATSFVFSFPCVFGCLDAQVEVQGYGHLRVLEGQTPAAAVDAFARVHGIDADGTRSAMRLRIFRKSAVPPVLPKVFGRGLL